MQAQMATGIFQYESCELKVENKVLYVRFPATGRVLRISYLTEASLIRTGNGLYQLQLSTPRERYEFLVEDSKMAEDALSVLVELIKGNSRLDLMSTE